MHHSAQCQWQRYAPIFSLMVFVASKCKVSTASPIRTAPYGCQGTLETVMTDDFLLHNWSHETYFPLSLLQLLFRRGLLDICFSHHLVSFLEKATSQILYAKYFSIHFQITFQQLPMTRHPAEYYPGTKYSMSSIGKQLTLKRQEGRSEDQTPST